MLTSVSVTKHSARSLRVAQLKTRSLRVINNVKMEENKIPLRREGRRQIRSLIHPAACFYDDLGYFGRGLCLLATTATTRLLSLLWRKNSLSAFPPRHSTLNVSECMTYLRPARAGSEAFSVLFITSV